MGSLLRTARTMTRIGLEIANEVRKLAHGVLARSVGRTVGPDQSLTPTAQEQAAPSPPAVQARRAPARTPRPTPETARIEHETAHPDDADPIDTALAPDGVLRLAHVDPDARADVIDLEAERDEVRGGQSV